jgi:2-polyprenyl-3-methyl-5-hydroxy-6-metoxy-1,4-benzoquinol methylase
VLDVGCGMGELAEQLQQAGIPVCAVDLSARMVELTKQRGVDAIVADVQQLPFADGEFEVAVANWVLYHVPDLDRGVAELARVLEPGGRLIASTVGENNMVELWEHVGGSATRNLSFGPDNGSEVLRRHFAEVERRDVLGTAVFPDTESIKRFVAMTIAHAHLAENVSEIDEPFETRSAHTVFIARQAA